MATIWTQAADVGPPQRGSAALGYDATRERIVHFGGANIGGIFERDTWEWDGNAWEQVANMGPTPRRSHAMTGTSGATLLFGGLGLIVENTPTELFGDTWTWDGQYWRQRQDMGPSPRFWSAMAWDDARERGVLFGGVTLVAGEDMFLNDPGNHSRPRNSERSLMRGPGSGPRGNRSPGGPLPAAQATHALDDIAGGTPGSGPGGCGKDDDQRPGGIQAASSSRQAPVQAG
jgi:hypothetical protein